MKHLLKEIVPPIFIKLFRKDAPGAVQEKPVKIFSSYQEALEHCTDSAYEEEELIEVIFKKTRRFTENLKTEVIPVWDTAAYNLLSVINPIVETKTNVINVLDFGGACGAHYFHFRNFLDASLKLNWVVVETPTMVRYARKLESDELSFFDNFSDAVDRLGTVDLLHTSGTLQCVDDPQKYLDQILECNARWVLFNRLGLNKNNRDIISIHESKLSWNGIGELPEGHTDRWIKYPFHFQSESKFLERIQSEYQVIAKLGDQSGMFAVDGEDITGYGLLCKKQD